MLHNTLGGHGLGGPGVSYLLPCSTCHPDSPLFHRPDGHPTLGNNASTGHSARGLSGLNCTVCSSVPGYASRPVECMGLSLLMEPFVGCGPVQSIDFYCFVPGIGLSVFTRAHRSLWTSFPYFSDNWRKKINRT